MIKIGIDYSLNSPSICVDLGDRLEFISFFNTEDMNWKKEPPLKKFFYHNEIKNLITLKPYNRTNTFKDLTYKEEQRVKLTEANMISKLILSTIINSIPPNHLTDIKIALEGFAYQSSGQSFIDLIMFNTILRMSVIDMFGDNALVIIAPTEAKRLAGKGNANKEYMVNAFKENKLQDSLLSTNPLYNYINTHELDFKNIKPLDDLVDSYWLLRTLD